MDTDTRMRDWSLTFAIITPIAVWVIVPVTINFLHAKGDMKRFTQIEMGVLCILIWALGMLALWISKSGER